jgi:hypothetical protein
VSALELVSRVALRFCVCVVIFGVLHEVVPYPPACQYEPGGRARLLPVNTRTPDGARLGMIESGWRTACTERGTSSARSGHLRLRPDHFEDPILANNFPFRSRLALNPLRAEDDPRSVPLPNSALCHP